jgi:hypothetical protein
MLQNSGILNDTTKSELVYIYKEINRRLNLRNACYHLVLDLVPCLLSNNLKIKLCGTIILSVTLYTCETWCLILREDEQIEGDREQSVDETVWI